MNSEAIVHRGYLRAGVSLGFPGFSERRADTGEGWRGFDVDFARALAIAVLGDPSRVEFIPLRTDVRFPALQRGEIDVGVFNATASLSREIQHDAVSVHPLLFDGERLMTRVGLSTPQRAEDGSNGKIAAIHGSVTRENLAAYIRLHSLPHEILEYPDGDAARTAYLSDECDYYCLDRYMLYGERASFFAPDEHKILETPISQDYMSPVVSSADANWMFAVTWIARSLIAAEDLNLGRSTNWADVAGDAKATAFLAGTAAIADRYGLLRDFAQRMLSEIGHYGELFARNLGDASPLRAPRDENRPRSRGGLLTSPVFT